MKPRPFGRQLLLGAGLPARAQGVARRAAQLDDVAGPVQLLDVDVGELRSETAEVLGDKRQVVGPSVAAHRGDVRHHDDSRLGRLLHGRQQRLTGVREGGDDVDLLSDQAPHVRDRLSRLGTGVRVDDLSDLRVAECLKHELHVGDLAPDVLAEAVGQSDGEVAVARVTDVVLPALERQLNVDGLAGAS